MGVEGDVGSQSLPAVDVALGCGIHLGLPVFQAEENHVVATWQELHAGKGAQLVIGGGSGVPSEMVSLLLVHVYLDRISRFDGTRIVVNNEGPWLRKIDGVLRGVSVDVLALVIFQGDNASVLGVTSRYDVLDVETCGQGRSEEHTSELQSRQYLVCRLLLEKKILILVWYLYTMY